MTFQELVSNAHEWIGGNLETQEGEYEGYNTKIAGLSIDNKVFRVHTTCGNMVAVATEYSEPKVLKENIVRFNIPYVGVAYMTKQLTKSSQQQGI